MPSRRSTLAAALAVLAALAGVALRAWDLGGVPLRWDEGWSIAHASLPLTDIIRITAQDVHPPLYYALLGAWQALTGVTPFAARWLSVLASGLSVPLTYSVGRAWSGKYSVALMAALLQACLPLAVYYGAVTRMYALAPTFVLLALWGGLRLARGAPAVAAFAFGASAAMWTLYHAAWALAGMGIWLLIRHWRAGGLRLVLRAVLYSVLLYAPWALYGIPRLFGRAAAESATNTNQTLSPVYFAWLAVQDLALTQHDNNTGLWVMLALLALGALCALVAQRGSTSSQRATNSTGRTRTSPSLGEGDVRLRRSTQLHFGLRAAALPALMICLTVAGVSIAARQWAYNARMLTCVAPALALVLAWAIEQLRGLPLNAARTAAPAGAALALLAAFWNTSTDFVYRKSLEVFDAYSTRAYGETMRAQARPGDVAFFNVLSPAGFFLSQRTPDDPGMSYALTWDPVKEPRADWEARIRAASARHTRIWLVLYRGLAANSNNGELRGFMDSTFFPAWSRWGEEEVFYGLYGVAGDMREGPSAEWDGDGITLRASRIGASARPGDIAPVALTWRVTQPVTRELKVFVHLTKPDGFVIGQHDAAPLNDLRPFATLPPGEDARDHHGVIVPADASGTLLLRVGLYDARSGERLRTRDGRDAVELGALPVVR